MQNAARDSTEEWLLPETAKPPTIAELERRIETALAIARASEEAVMTVADAALESAAQARRAAEVAERAAAEVAAGRGGAAAGGGAGEARNGNAPLPEPAATSAEPVASVPSPDPGVASAPGRAPTPSRQDWLEAFERRAADLNARFARL